MIQNQRMYSQENQANLAAGAASFQNFIKKDKKAYQLANLDLIKIVTMTMHYLKQDLKVEINEKKSHPQNYDVQQAQQLLSDPSGEYKVVN